MAGRIGYKLWRLREGSDVRDVFRLVQEEIVPHYARLSPEVSLSLDLLDGEAGTPRQVLAVQHWRTPAAREAAFGGPEFDAWWQDYQSVLASWDHLVELVSEWECERLV